MIEFNIHQYICILIYFNIFALIHELLKDLLTTAPFTI